MNVVDLTSELIRFPSVSSESNVAVTDRVEEVLSTLGFRCERVDYTDKNGVAKTNVIGKRGEGAGGLGFFSHNDVVPAEKWSAPGEAFRPEISGDKLYGRGSCDMKGPFAAALAAIARVAANEHSQPLWFVCTADEEVGYAGIREVVANSAMYREMVSGGTRAVITEPTRMTVVYSHKGSFGFRVTARGVAAHSSRPEGINANLQMIPFLAEMKRIFDETESQPRWHNHDFHPPTLRWNIGINDHTRAVNVTAGQSVCTVYFRPMPGVESDILWRMSEELAAEMGLEFESLFKADPMPGDPGSEYVTRMTALTNEFSGKDKAETVSYGTDGALMGELADRIVCGPGDIAQAHTKDEWIELSQLEQGVDCYERMIREFCT